MQASIELNRTPAVQYLLRIGDTCLVLAQRLGEWCGHAPVLEEDIAMANIALDLVGQARGLLTHAGTSRAANTTKTSSPTCATSATTSTSRWSSCRAATSPLPCCATPWSPRCSSCCGNASAASSDAEVAAIAGKAVKEARYHQQHSADWVVRLGDGTDESRRRTEKALKQLWLYVPELFESDAVDEAASASGLGPAWSELREPWLAEMQQVLDAAGLAMPKEAAFRSTGKQGVHSEHMGYILTEMQHLQRSFPGGVW
jgi:ring-1,2-phenylacetyl-CoA epoxidase subunit PaaC